MRSTDPFRRLFFVARRKGPGVDDNDYERERTRYLGNLGQEDSGVALL